MASRKQKNLEIERQVKQRQLVFRTVSIIVAAVILAAVAIGVWTVQDSRWLMRYDGGRVAVSDFRAVMDLGFQNDPQWHDMAINSIQAITVMHDRADMHNVGPTREERATAEQEMQEIREARIAQVEFDTFHYITNARLAVLFMTDIIRERLMDIYVPTYNVDEAEFAQALEEFLADAYYEYMNMQALMVVTDNLEDMEEAQALALSGEMDFEDVSRMFTEGFDEDSEIEPVSPLEFAVWFEFTQEDRDNLFYLEVGEISEIISFEEGGLYFLFKMVSRDDAPDVDALTADFRADFIERGRHNVFDDIVEQWVEEANFTINRRGYNTLGL